MNSRCWVVDVVYPFVKIKYKNLRYKNQKWLFIFICAIPYLIFIPFTLHVLLVLLPDTRLKLYCKWWRWSKLNFHPFSFSVILHHTHQTLWMWWRYSLLENEKKTPKIWIGFEHFVQRDERYFAWWDKTNLLNITAVSISSDLRLCFVNNLSLPAVLYKIGGCQKRFFWHMRKLLVENCRLYVFIFNEFLLYL